VALRDFFLRFGSKEQSKTIFPYGVQTPKTNPNSTLRTALLSGASRHHQCYTSISTLLSTIIFDDDRESADLNRKSILMIGGSLGKVWMVDFCLDDSSAHLEKTGAMGISREN